MRCPRETPLNVNVQLRRKLTFVFLAVSDRGGGEPGRRWRLRPATSGHVAFRRAMSKADIAGVLP
jgi:hypothetical protein